MRLLFIKNKKINFSIRNVLLWTFNGPLSLTGLALFIFFCANNTSAAIIKPTNNLGLVGWWPMDEGAGTIAHDFSGNKKNGKILNNPDWTDSKNGKGLNFSVSNQMVDLGDNLDYPGQSFSVCAWTYTTDDTTDGYIFGKFDGSNGFWMRRFSQTPPTIGTWQADVGINNNLTLVDGAPINTWVHLCAVIVPGPGTSTFYINGRVGATSVSVSATPDTTVSATIGNRYDSARPYAGKIDDVRFYNRAITAGEVLSLYQNNSSVKIGSTRVGQDSLSQGLVGWWTMDGKDMNWATGRLSDASGTGNTGIVSGMATNTAPVFGKIGQALKFNGVNSYVQIPTAASLRP